MEKGRIIRIDNKDRGIYVIEGRKKPGFIVTPTDIIRIPECRYEEKVEAIKDYMLGFKR